MNCKQLDDAINQPHSARYFSYVPFNMKVCKQVHITGVTDISETKLDQWDFEKIVLCMQKKFLLQMQADFLNNGVLLHKSVSARQIKVL